MEELLKKTETMLRAVLVSSPRGVPLYRLDREYRSITFEPIPFNKCGFKTLEDFLRSIPKVARITKDRDGELVVTGVPSEADQHVAKLIAKQKKPKIRKSTSRPARRPSALSSRTYTPAKSNGSRFGPRSSRAFPPISRPLLPTPSSSASKPPPHTPRFVPPRLAKKVFGVNQSQNIQVSTSNQRKVTVNPFSASVSDEKPQQTSTKSSSKRTVKAKGPNFGGMEISLSTSTTPPPSPVSKQPTANESFLTPEILERIGNIAGCNKNGFFLSRLPIVYKDKYQKELPGNVAEILQSYPHILHVEKLGNFYIAYPPKESKPQPTQEAPPRNKPEATTTKPTRKVIEVYSIKPYTVPALGAPLQVYISHIESVDDFYVQYKEYETRINELQDRLTNDMQSSAESISDPAKGMHCCAQFTQDDAWYRGQIIEIRQDNNNQNIKIFYVDFGNSEWLTLTRLRHLKKEHVELPRMAVHCRLHGVSSDDKAVDEKLNNLLDKESTMTVIERVGELLHVRLTDEKGVNIKATPKVKEEAPEPQAQDVKPEISSLTLKPTPDETNSGNKKSSEQKKTSSLFLRKAASIVLERKIPEQVVIPNTEYIDITVSTVFSTDHISVMLYGEDYSDKLLALETSMMSYFLESTDDESFTPKVGEVYAIKSSELHSEDQYYRVKVVSIDGDEAMLEFADYGDTKKAPLAALQWLPQRFLELPFQAFTISLHEIPKTKKPQVLDRLKHHILDKPLVAEVCDRTHQKLVVEIYDTSTEMDVNINEVIRSLIIPDEDLVPALPKGRWQVEARISHITSTGTVFVQIPGAGLNRLEELMTDITQHYNSKSTKAAEFVSHPSVGHICCAKCADGSWYRAVILEQLPDRKVKVQCVDYGNTETIPRTALREPTKANEHVSVLPFQAKECLLHGVDEDTWSDEKAAKMNELISEDVLLEVTKQDTIPTVKIFLITDDDQLINIVDFVNDELSTSKSDSSQSGSTAELDQTEKESLSQEDDQDDSSPDLPPPITLPRPWVDVTISDVIDPGHFMFQPLEKVPALEENTKQMNEYYKSVGGQSNLVSPRNGDLCAVKDTDGHYYRAIVKAVLSSKQICVHFIDFGNVGIKSSQDFRDLPDQFKQLPAVAVKGSLAGVHPLDDSGEWSDDAIKRFEELTSWKMFVASVDGDQYQYNFRDEHKISLKLFDTSGDNDINIAELLLNEGLVRKIDE